MKALRPSTRLTLALALVLFGAAHHAAMALAASVIEGASWIATLSSLNVSAQLALPEWVRGRGLAMYVTVFFGALTLGSIAWGEIAGVAGLPVAHFLAAAGAVIAIPLTWHWKLQTGKGLDLTPSMHWPAPVVAGDLEERAGPVLVMIEYQIAIEDRNAFLKALEHVSAERRRDGAYAGDVFEDVSAPGRIVETFLVESWVEHLRQHERVTNADRVVQECVQRFLLHPSTITHFVAARPEREQPHTRSAG